MITYGDIDRAMANPHQLEALALRLERTNNADAALRVLFELVGRWGEVCNDGAVNDELVKFSDDVLDVIGQQQLFAEQLDEATKLDRDQLISLLTAMEIELTELQEDALGW